MQDVGDAGFLETLPVFLAFEDVADQTNYRPLPAGWALAVADIVDSTGAIAEGRYKTVNMAGAGVISAILNAASNPDLPFIFGGDGAMVALPPNTIAAARNALSAVVTWVAEDLDLTMRAAIVPVEAIRAAGQDVCIARFRVSPGLSYAMFSGGGASWAETRMKAGEFTVAAAPPETRPDLTGLSCRWSPIPARHGQIVSIIATPGPAGDEQAFRDLVAGVVAVAATEERDGHPVPPEGPEFALSMTGVEHEARNSAGTPFLRKIAILVQCGLMFLLYRLNLPLGGFDARRYKRELAENTDFRKFDDGLKMTLDVDADRLGKIERLLEDAASKGVSLYGLHRQDAALMTCLVPSAMSAGHMHFVDGAAGGYAEAASRLKARDAVTP